MFFIQIFMMPTGDNQTKTLSTLFFSLNIEYSIN